MSIEPPIIRNLDGVQVCGVESESNYAFMAGRWSCSLPPEHVNDPNSAHRAYENHRVTGHGRNLLWLGPWTDERPWKGPEADLFTEQWAARYDDPIWVQEQADAERAMWAPADTLDAGQ